jgi:hypothetical protein
MHGETLHAMQPEPKTQSTRAFATTRARQQIVLGFKQEMAKWYACKSMLRHASSWQHRTRASHVRDMQHPIIVIICHCKFVFSAAQQTIPPRQVLN